MDCFVYYADFQCMICLYSVNTIVLVHQSKMHLFLVNQLNQIDLMFRLTWQWLIGLLLAIESRINLMRQVLESAKIFSF